MRYVPWGTGNVVSMSEISRKQFLAALGVVALGSAVPVAGLAGAVRPELFAASPSDLEAQAGEAEKLTLAEALAAMKVAGYEISEEDLTKILGDLNDQRSWYAEVRAEANDDRLAPGSVWRMVEADQPDATKGRVSVKTRRIDAKRPARDEDLAFMSVVELSHLLKTKQITSVQLTEIFLDRLKTYGPKLRCVVNLTQDRARAEARRADERLRSREKTPLLCGIPYGVKDLFDAVGAPTTWGCRTFKDRTTEDDSDVVRLLSEQGAVLVAKLSLGALAMGDVWYEGRTESPWDPKVGSSGSSAGSASAVAAGLVPFAIGTETSGSIVSPAHNCRVTGLRPTFGRISRFGAMALCWSLDKVGPICRDAEDCAGVFGSLLESTGRDRSQVSKGFVYDSATDLSKMRLGFLVNREQDLDKPLPDLPYLATLKKIGINPKPVYLPPAPNGLYAILFAECGAAFDHFTRSGAAEDLESYSTWPDTFRQARLIPAMDLIQADRVRVKLAEEYSKRLAGFDAIIAADRLYPRVYALNVTGHPQMSIPWGVDDRGQARSFSLIGPAYSEASLLRVAYEMQLRGGYLQLRPDMKQWT